MKPALSCGIENLCLNLFLLKATFQKKNHTFGLIENTNKHFVYFPFHLHGENRTQWAVMPTPGTAATSAARTPHCPREVAHSTPNPGVPESPSQ